MQKLIKQFANIGSYEAERIVKRDELISEIEYLTGYRLETLRDMFAAGWTLKPPGQSKSINEVMNERAKLLGLPNKPKGQ